jgi:hypothetical protein
MKPCGKSLDYEKEVFLLGLTGKDTETVICKAFLGAETSAISCFIEKPFAESRAHLLNSF